MWALTDDSLVEIEGFRSIDLPSHTFVGFHGFTVLDDGLWGITEAGELAHASFDGTTTIEARGLRDTSHVTHLRNDIIISDGRSIKAFNRNTASPSVGRRSSPLPLTTAMV